MEGNELETGQRRRNGVRRVYEQNGGALRWLKRLDFARDVLVISLRVELKFTFGTGLKAMDPCLGQLEALDISRVEDCGFSMAEYR